MKHRIHDFTDLNGVTHHYKNMENSELSLFPIPECFGHREIERYLPPSAVYCYLCMAEDACINKTFDNIICQIKDSQKEDKPNE
jgi:hypothetical protein